jgi:transposase
MSLFGTSPEKEKPIELIKPEIIPLPKKTRKKKPTLKEQFKDIPVRQVPVDTLSKEEKVCLLCVVKMVPIGTEVIRSEVVYTPPKLERIEYVATTYCDYVLKNIIEKTEFFLLRLMELLLQL